MKNLIITAVFSFFAMGNMAMSSAEVPATSGSIIIQDDVTLIVDTENPLMDVADIQIFGAASPTACEEPICFADVSYLSSGIYYIEAETDTGLIFSGYIIKN